MKSGKFTTMKAVALGVAVMFIAASCGSSDSSGNGKTKNSTACFGNNDEKNLAISNAATAFGAALMLATNGHPPATSTTGASGGYRMPAVRSMDVNTTVPPVTTVPLTTTTEEPTTTVLATDETTTTTLETTVPSSNPSVVNNIQMLQQALWNAEKQPLCETVNAASDNSAEPYLNEVTDVTATTNTDGSVVLNWTAPKASNVEPGMILLFFSRSSWGIHVSGSATSYKFDAEMLRSQNFSSGTFELYPQSTGCLAGGTGACFFGPRTEVAINYLTSDSTDSTDTTDTTDTTDSTDTTDTTDTTVAPTDTTIATVTTDATATTVQANPEVVIIQTSLSAVELLTETPVLVTTDVVSMVCDEDCISTMFAAAALDRGTISINGVSASFGSESLRFPLDGKTGSIQAVVTSSDGKSALDMSTNFDRVEEIYAPVALASAEAATSTSGSSKSIYMYVLIALLVLIVIGYMRRKKATETK